MAIAAPLFPVGGAPILPRPVIAAPCMAQRPGAGKALCETRPPLRTDSVKALLALAGNPVFMSIQ